MKKILLTASSLIAAAASQAQNLTKTEEDCQVLAWVRAEDLRPDHISHGELRIKVQKGQTGQCANRIASVSLRLQLDEFSEVKHLRRGVVLPGIPKADNQTIPTDFTDWGFNKNDAVYDYSGYDRAMSDPAFWVVKAEERRAWTTEAVLFENNPDFSQAMVTPFIVAAPAVNYPPAVTTYRSIDSTMQPIQRHAYSQIGYHYIAVVSFTDGRTVNVPAGHTNFVPVSAPVEIKPFTLNATFRDQDDCGDPEQPNAKKLRSDMERCLPEELRSAFYAEVTLDKGNVIQRGQSLKGKVTVHAVTNGSTKMAAISATLMPRLNHRWATEQATTGGDENFNVSTYLRNSATFGVISIGHHSFFFQESDSMNYEWENHQPSGSGSLTSANPSFDFELQVLQTAAPDFLSYYSSGEASLELKLTVLHSQDAAVCIHGVDRYTPVADEGSATQDDAAKTEEGLWDAYTRVGEPVNTRPADWWRRNLILKTTVPLVILGDISTRPVEHYLTPGLPSPVILPAQGDVVFPAAQPEVIEEPLANTTLRLLRSGGTFDPYEAQRQFWNHTRLHRFGRDMPPDPASSYNQGIYAGLLWKKKVVAEERGLWPPQSTATEVARDDNTQQRFVVIP
ncbi:hypothetical protein B0H11DRAFT_2030589 [Mycena galericulata]|nr:hypothetical protein B0H11DRAFT_2030589 [Mycena galericulata]